METKAVSEKSADLHWCFGLVQLLAGLPSSPLTPKNAQSKLDEVSKS
jgi:hypothetical protein